MLKKIVALFIFKSDAVFKTPTEPAHTSSKTENGGTYTTPAAVKEDQIDIELQKQVEIILGIHSWDNRLPE